MIRKRTPAQMRRLVGQWRASGESGARFARRHHAARRSPEPTPQGRHSSDDYLDPAVLLRLSSLYVACWHEGIGGA